MDKNYYLGMSCSEPFRTLSASKVNRDFYIRIHLFTDADAKTKSSTMKREKFIICTANIINKFKKKKVKKMDAKLTHDRAHNAYT